MWAGKKKAPTEDVITTTDNQKGWIIQTKSSAYQLVLTKDNKVQQVYYGPLEQLSFKQQNAQWVKDMDEVTVRGGFENKTPLIEVVCADGGRDGELTFADATIV